MRGAYPIQHEVHGVVAGRAGGGGERVARQCDHALLGGQAVLEPHVRVGAPAQELPVAAEPVRVRAAVKRLSPGQRSGAPGACSVTDPKLT